MLLIAIVGTVAAARVSTASVAMWLAHPVRVDADGTPPAVTFTGALWLRIAWMTGPWCALVLVFAIRRAARNTTPPLPLRAPSRATLIGLAGLAVASVCVRCITLSESLWYDELVGFGAYSLLGPATVIGNYFSQANHILSQVLIWCSTWLFGVNEVSMRLPSLLASLATIVAAFALGREVRDDRTGLFAALAMSVMPIVVLSGTDARGYSFMILGATLATWLLFNARRTGSTVAWTLYALVIALSAWSHLVSIMFALGHGAWLLFDLLRGRERGSPGTGLVALVLSGVVALMLYAPVLPDILALRGQFRVTSDTQPSLLGIETQHALIALGGAWTWWAAVPGGVLVLIGLWTLRQVPRLRDATIAGFLGLPIAYGLAAVGDSWLYARFLLFVTPAIALLMARGLDVLAARRSSLAITAAALWTAIAITSIAILPPRQPLREAMLTATSLRSAAHETVGVIGLRDNPLLYYAIAYRSELVDFGDRGVRLEATLDATLEAQRPRAIVILYASTLPPERLATLAARGYTRTTTLPGWIDWGAGTVEVWKRD